MFSCSTYCAQNHQTYIDMADVTLHQLEEPEDNAPTAIIHTTAGDITAVLYPEEAPEYVAQFTRLAKEGYYDGTYVFQVEKDVYFSAGSPDVTGSVDGTQAASPEERSEPDPAHAGKQSPKPVRRCRVEKSRARRCSHPTFLRRSGRKHVRHR